jgi:hypothetical protein
MNRARTTLTLLFVISAAFAWACGGSDDSTTDDGGGSDGTVGNDTGPGKDGSSSDGTTNDTGANDGGTSDGGTSDGSTSDGAISDASIDVLSAFTCQKPSDCDAGFCCGTIIFNGGTLPNCILEDASSTCAST